jgi:quercetin dioxygenase-like cupin family protein
MTRARFEKLERQRLFEKVLPEEHAPVRFVKGARIRFAPGQPSGLHRHPMSTCGVVTAGRFILEVDGETARELNVGDAFFEPEGTTIRRFDNASESHAGEIVCFYLTDDTERAPIEMLASGMDEQLGMT